MKLHILIIALLAFAIVACQQTSQPAPQQMAPADELPPAVTAKQETKTAANVTPDSRKQNEEVVKLFDRIGQVKSYSFSIANLPDKRGSHQYYVRGDNVRIVPIKSLLKEQDIDEVFLNTATKQAAAYCLPSSSCKDPNAPFPASYSDWEIVMPLQWVEHAKYGTKTGSLTFYNKPVTVIEYEAEGKYYEVYVDNYFGMPQRVAIATDAEMQNIIGGYEYRQMAYNSIKEEDVTHK